MKFDLKSFALGIISFVLISMLFDFWFNQARLTIIDKEKGSSASNELRFVVKNIGHTTAHNVSGSCEPGIIINNHIEEGYDLRPGEENSYHCKTLNDDVVTQVSWTSLFIKHEQKQRFVAYPKADNGVIWFYKALSAK